MEIKQKDFGSKSRNFSVRISCKVYTQGWRNFEEYNYELQINLYVAIVQTKNMAITNDDRYRAALIMYENYICQYKAILLQCERDFDLMINTRLNQEIGVPYFTVKHGQFAAVALTRSGVNKLLRKPGKHLFSEEIGFL